MAPHLEKDAKGLVTERLRETRAQRFPRSRVHISSRHVNPQRVNIPHIVTQPQVTADDVFEQSDSLSFHELVDHVAENGADGVEAFIGMAYVRQAGFIEKNLLHNKNCNGF